MPADAARADASRRRSSISVVLHCRIVSLKRLKWAMAMADGDVAMVCYYDPFYRRHRFSVLVRFFTLSKNVLSYSTMFLLWTNDRGESFSPNSSIIKHLSRV